MRRARSAATPWRVSIRRDSCRGVKCSVLQRVAACCSVLQRGAACCRVLQHVAACCSVLQRIAVYRVLLAGLYILWWFSCSVLHSVAMCCNMWASAERHDVGYTATCWVHCNMLGALQHNSQIEASVAMCGIVLQCCSVHIGYTR